MGYGGRALVMAGLAAAVGGGPLVRSGDPPPTSDPPAVLTATATMSAPFGNTPESLVLVGDDVAVRLCDRWTDEPFVLCVENRRVDGQLYVYIPQYTADDEMLAPSWLAMPDDYTTLSRHPTASSPFELLAAVQERVELVDDGTEVVAGETTTRLWATDLEGVDVGFLPLVVPPHAQVVEIELWVRDDGVVVRAEALVTMPLDVDDPDSDWWTDRWWIEFADIGDPTLRIDVPPGAVLSRAAG